MALYHTVQWYQCVDVYHDVSQHKNISTVLYHTIPQKQHSCMWLVHFSILIPMKLGDAHIQICLLIASRCFSYVHDDVFYFYVHINDDVFMSKRLKKANEVVLELSRTYLGSSWTPGSPRFSCNSPVDNKTSKTDSPQSKQHTHMYSSP